MLFQVHMHVNVPTHIPAAEFDEIKAREKAYFQELQKAGKWRHIWRHVGQYSNTSIFDVESNAALHDLLMGLPLYPFMDIEVIPLCRHPSSIHDDDR
ncbi:muconolactone Delta-isomerase [Sphingomonas histidinilytica]|jgi:muconolactone D-isomerase|uniref:Muconolactone Delta-isomerase n=1 Tax=Rhizorhabdus histidinilytica TaxID=439228 RepID=A0A1T5BJ91_9SPHN|nr:MULTISPECIES: muconolactone Delta-isomerase [Sphingomonadaceae]MBO9377368.1 muconolactone Delta-isomerase [Rhizorhabdus histidinilytica]QEH77579.1 muconolactone Delta-isomerase [Sphingomonas sp. C8-2]SKB47382.1 muconolactone delta-isomerase [Rhizorhabdus histidinilytica]